MVRQLFVSLVSFAVAATAAMAPATVSAQQTIVILLDDSGSMLASMRSDQSVTRIEAAKDALRETLNQIPDQATVGVMALNMAGSDGWVVPLRPIDRESLQQRIEAIRANGGTPLGKKLKQAADALLQRREEQEYGQYRLLIVTDGEATDRELLEQYVPEVFERGIRIDVIGLDMEQDHSLATKVHSYRRANDPAGLQRAISEVIAETDVEDETSGQDYELIASLPDQFAVAAIDSLTSHNNSPIGASDAFSSTRQDSPPALPAPRPGPGTVFELEPADRTSTTWWMIALVVVGLLVAVGQKIIRLSRRRGR